MHLTTRPVIWIGWIGILVAGLLVGGGARAQVETSWSVSLQSDLRYTVDEKTKMERIPDAEVRRNPYLRGMTRRKIVLIPRGFSRNENAGRFKFTAETDKLKGVAEIEFAWLGYSRDLQTLEGTTRREVVDPYRLEVHALYLDVTGFIFDNLDLRIGEQVINWGTADQFNPTSNLTPLDLEDPLQFGEHMAVPAIKLNYSFNMDWMATLAWVPIFKPYHFPASATLGLSSPDRTPLLDPAYRWRFAVDRSLGEIVASGPTWVTETRILLPPRTIDNSQVGFKIRGKVFNQDISLSYFYGRSGMPQPSLSRSFLNSAENYIDVRVDLMYPRMHVVGFDMAGQIPWFKALSRRFPKLKPVGWWFEAAAFFPQRVTMAMYQSDFGLVADGEYDYDDDGVQGGPRPVVVDTTPFLKWVLGFDYSFSKHWYANVQWVHGFPDEFGAGGWLSDLWSKQKGRTVGKAWYDGDFNHDGHRDIDPLTCKLSGEYEKCVGEYTRPRIGDYIVAGLDFKFKEETMLLRLFFILDMSGLYEEYWDGPADGLTGHRVTKWHHPFSAKGFSAVIFPQFTWAVAEGAELSAGAFLMLGKDYSRFGDPAAGGSVVWTRAKFTY